MKLTAILLSILLTFATAGGAIALFAENDPEPSEQPAAVESTETEEYGAHTPDTSSYSFNVADPSYQDATSRVEAYKAQLTDEMKATDGTDSDFDWSEADYSFAKGRERVAAYKGEALPETERIDHFAGSYTETYSTEGYGFAKGQQRVTEYKANLTDEMKATDGTANPGVWSQEGYSFQIVANSNNN